MKERKHKRKLNHVLILTSDAADANVKQFRIRAWLAEVIVIMLCILIGGVIGYFIYEGQLWTGGSPGRGKQDTGGAEQQAGGSGNGTGGRNPDTE